MADQPQAPIPPKPVPPPTFSRPVPPPPPPNVPTAPPQGLQVKDTNISHLSPSPAPFSGTPPVRTMQSDLGIKPAMPPLPPPPPPRPAAPPPMRPPAPVPAPAAPIAPINIPPIDDDDDHSSGGKKWIFIGIAGIVVLFGLIWFFAFRGSTPEATPTPTPEETETPISTPTPPLAGFNEIFHVSEPIRMLHYSTTNNPKTALKELDTSINQEIITPGDVKIYRIDIATQAVEISNEQALKDFGINPPSDLSAILAPGQIFFFALFGKPDGTNGRGFFTKLQPGANADAILASWESTMTTALKDLFKITPSKAASTGFLENTYLGVKIRYRNFGDALNSIDYAILTMPNGDRYLTFTNTRDHMFLLIDTALAAVPGK